MKGRKSTIEKIVVKVKTKKKTKKQRRKNKKKPKETVLTKEKLSKDCRYSSDNMTLLLIKNKN